MRRATASGTTSVRASLGAYATDVDGLQGYCIDLGLNSPFNATSPAQTIGSLPGVSTDDLARLNYVLANWGQSGDPNVTSAVALFTWSLADPSVYNSHSGISGDNYYVGSGAVS